MGRTMVPTTGRTVGRTVDPTVGRTVDPTVGRTVGGTVRGLPICVTYVLFGRKVRQNR